MSADDVRMDRWKDEAKSRGLSFAAFCREALDAKCEDFGAIRDRVVEKAKPLVVADAEDRGVKGRMVETASSDLFEPLAEPKTQMLVDAEIATPVVPEYVRDNTVARIFGRLESGEASPSKPKKFRSQPCEHRIPPSAFCAWCDG